MRKKSYKNLFISLLIIAAVFVNISSAFAAKSKKHKGKQSAKKAADTVQKKKKARKLRTEIKYTGFEAKRNPFAPPEKVAKMLAKPDEINGAEKIETVKLPKVDVQGIVWSKTMPQVIVNETVMKVGDYIQEFQIKEITRNGIILFHKGKEYLMKIQKHNNKKKKTRKRRKR